MLRILTLSEHMLVAAAHARRNSLLLRICHNIFFTLGVSLTIGSATLPVLFYVLNVALMASDVWCGRQFLQSTGRRKDFFRVVFVANSVASITAFMGIGVCGALYGGEAGRLAAAFLAAGSLVTVMVMMVEAPILLILCAAPASLSLIALPALPTLAHGQGGVVAMLGLYVTLGAFASHLTRTAVQHTRLFGRLKDARDEAERRRAEAEARRADAEAHRREAEHANRVKSEFLFAMTHELRTPLNAVINYAEMIEEEVEGVVKEDATRISRSAHHLLSLIDRIIDFSTIDAGQLDLMSEDFSVREVVRAVAGANLTLASANGNSIVLDLRESALLNADRARFEQCLDNLVSNAVKFTKNGQITIETTQDARAFTVSVSDTGQGMSAEQLAGVFNAFAQADGSKTRAVDGLGLGLAATLRLVRAMGGDLRAESTPGQGSRFDLVMPLPQPIAAAA